MSQVILGVEVIRKQNFAQLKGQRIGLVINPASLDSNFISTKTIFLSTNQVKVKALFGPQHGIRGETQDNMIEWEGFRDKKTGLPVYSLYGKTREPLPEMLESIDCLIIDFPDVGARYYTFIWTMALTMKACRKYGKACVVLDRPNPITGLFLEGPMLNPKFSSFVGLYPLPVRHGMTIGEIAFYLNQEFKIGSDLTVIPMEGWKREMWFDDTFLPWVMPSPNMPTLDTAIVYPGMCLLEGTNISEGRGTTRPFEIFGKPGIEPEELVKRLHQEELPGVKFRPLYFQPTFSKYQGELCGGAQIHIIDRQSFLPVLTGVAVICAIYQMDKEKFSWRLPPYEYETEKLPIDILAGTDKLRIQIESGCSLSEIYQSWQRDLDNFRKIRQQYLLYP